MSNICMTKPNRWFVRISVFLLLSSFTLSCGIQGHGQSNAMLAEPSQSLDNTPQATLDAVRVFYTYVTRYQPLGIPRGRAKKALWPLMSKRLGRELDSLQACDDDYYRRYGDILRAHPYKPAIPWLEEGLFSGPNEAAGSTKFSILGSRAIGNNRFEVQLRFTQKQTYSPDLGLPPSYDHTGGAVTAILENKQWVIDDFVGTYENDERRRLSDGYPECKSGRWVGANPY